MYDVSVMFNLHMNQVSYNLIWHCFLTIIVLLASFTGDYSVMLKSSTVSACMCKTMTDLWI